MEQKSQSALEIVRDAPLLIKAQDVRIAKLNASLFVIQSALAGTLSPSVYKELVAQEEKARNAAAGAEIPALDKLIDRLATLLHLPPDGE